MRNFCLSVLIGTLFFSTASAKCGTLVVEVIGIKEIKGHIVIGLYNKPKGFPDIGKQYKGTSTKITTNSVIYTFVDIPDGLYAIALFHDLNSNGKLDYNFLGIPKERYAFSCITKTCLKAPKFHEAKFEFKDNHKLKVKLK